MQALSARIHDIEVVKVTPVKKSVVKKQEYAGPASIIELAKELNKPKKDQSTWQRLDQLQTTPPTPKLPEKVHETFEQEESVDTSNYANMFSALPPSESIKASLVELEAKEKAYVEQKSLTESMQQSMIVAETI